MPNPPALSLGLHVVTLASFQFCILYTELLLDVKMLLAKSGWSCPDGIDWNSCLWLPVKEKHYRTRSNFYSLRFAWFKSSSAKQMISVFFWDITQLIVLTSNRGVVTAYWSHLEGSRNPIRKINSGPLALKYGTDRLSRNVSKELPLCVA